MITQNRIKITGKGPGIFNITHDLQKHLTLPEKGLCFIHLLHTSAGLALTENSSAAVWKDLSRWLEDLAPESSRYEHDEEGPDDMPAHLKSLLTGVQVTIPIEDHQFCLGKWQGIFLFEFRKAAPDRTLAITILH